MTPMLPNQPRDHLEQSLLLEVSNFEFIAFDFFSLPSNCRLRPWFNVSGPSGSAGGLQNNSYYLLLVGGTSEFLLHM